MAEVFKIYDYTPMIRLSDMKYPVYLSHFRAEHKNISMGDWVWEHNMDPQYGYYMVHDVEIPEGEVVEEGKPQKGDDGKWYKTWTARNFTEEEIAKNLKFAIEEQKYHAKQMYTQDLESGVLVDGLYYPVISDSAFDLLYIKNYAEKNLGSNIIIPSSDLTLVEKPAEEIISMIGTIFEEAGKINQRFLRYLKEASAATDIKDVPDAPSTFKI